MREYPNTGFARRPSSCQPGSKRLLDYLTAKFRLSNSGCFNAGSRLTSGKLSFHAYGKAIDLGCNWHDLGQRARGNQCFDWLLANREALGLQQVIWGDRIWDISYGVRAYRRDDHKNHVHVSLGYHASQHWTSTGQPAPAPAPAPPPLIPVGDNVAVYEFDNVLNAAWVDKEGRLQHDYLKAPGAAGQGWIGETLATGCKPGAPVAVLAVNTGLNRRHILQADGANGLETIVVELTTKLKVHRLATQG